MDHAFWRVMRGVWMTGFTRRRLHISSTCALASVSLAASTSRLNAWTDFTALTPLKPRSSSAFLVFAPSGSATPGFSSMRTSARYTGTTCLRGQGGCAPSSLGGWFPIVTDPRSFRPRRGVAGADLTLPPSVLAPGWMPGREGPHPRPPPDGLHRDRSAGDPRRGGARRRGGHRPLQPPGGDVQGVPRRAGAGRVVPRRRRRARRPRAALRRRGALRRRPALDAGRSQRALGGGRRVPDVRP